LHLNNQFKELTHLDILIAKHVVIPASKAYMK